VVSIQYLIGLAFYLNIIANYDSINKAAEKPRFFETSSHCSIILRIMPEAFAILASLIPDLLRRKPPNHQSHAQHFLSDRLTHVIGQ